MEVKFTCITCRVAFQDCEVQRQHYKTDWHRYNLKRKVAELPPVTFEEFQRRFLLQLEKDLKETSTSINCSICRKNFSSENSYSNHLNSKRHLLNEISSISEESSLPKNVNGKSTADDSDIEEVDSDEWEEDGEDNPIANNDCLFCSHHSANMIKIIKHMTVAHSFYIPDVEFVVDMKGLMMYLGEKVSKGYMCLWCNDTGRSFHSKEAAQQHMQDKGHCKMLHEGEALAEYADFYDYSSSYQGNDEDVDAEVSPPIILDDSDFQLVLPSGIKIGHRSLMRYYRQNFDPSRVVVPQKKLHRVLTQYRALGWTETQHEQAARKARDLHYIKRMQSKYYTKLGIRANKLQKHFRPQVNF